MTTQFNGHTVSKEAVEQFEKKDEELSVPEGAPRPVLIIVMVCPKLHDLRDSANIYRVLHPGEYSSTSHVTEVP